MCADQPTFSLFTEKNGLFVENKRNPRNLIANFTVKGTENRVSGVFLVRFIFPKMPNKLGESSIGRFLLFHFYFFIVL